MRQEIDFGLLTWEAFRAGIEWIFKMNYVLSILGVLVTGLVFLLAIRYWAWKNDEKIEKNRSETQSRLKIPAKKTAVSDPKGREIIKRELRKVTTPWGWPGHIRPYEAWTRPELSSAMRSFTKRLLEQKQLVNGTAIDPRLSGSFRALLEDRYAPAVKSIKYQKVKAPRLRDPNEPYDQMDSFGSREMKPDPRKLKRPAAMKADPAQLSKTGRFQPMDLQNIKKPWGW